MTHSNEWATFKPFVEVTTQRASPVKYCYPGVKLRIDRVACEEVILESLVVTVMIGWPTGTKGLKVVKGLKAVRRGWLHQGVSPAINANTRAPLKRALGHNNVSVSDEKEKRHAPPLVGSFSRFAL